MSSDISDMIIEKDVEVPTRDGSILYANIFRPKTQTKVPAILCMAPYGKDTPVLGVPRTYGREAATSPLAIWETADPAWWVPHGYALSRIDPRGSFKSPGKRDFMGRKEQEDFYDYIESMAKQPWCTGKIGLMGVSFYAMTQWLVAALNPPHLAAIVPWEGLSDLYREWARQGGMYSNCFTEHWWDSHFTSQGEDNKGNPFVDWRVEFKRREFDEDWYAERRAELKKITVPVLSAGNWGAFHMHLRGNIEGFLGVSSRHKRLFMFVGSHIGPFLTEWGKAEQLRFLDHWLRDIPNGAENDAPVRLAIRHGREIKWRDEFEWPLARTRWTKLFLDAQIGSLVWSANTTASKVSYTAPSEKTSFETSPVNEELEITGPVTLSAWVSSTTRDMDVFIALREIGSDGKEVSGIGPRGDPIQMGMGWLRASHRELDPVRSLPYRPYHLHKRALPLVPGEPTQLDIEVWPTSIVLALGHRLRLELSANDDHMALERYGHNDQEDRSPRIFSGDNTIHTGGKYDSHLLLPIIPAVRSTPV